MLKRVEQSNIVGLLKGNDVTKSKRQQGDGGDGGQKHGGGLNHAADGAGLIPQISDPPERLAFYVWASTCEKLAFSLLRYAHPHRGFCGL